MGLRLRHGHGRGRGRDDGARAPMLMHRRPALHRRAGRILIAHTHIAESGTSLMIPKRGIYARRVGSRHCMRRVGHLWLHQRLAVYLYVYMLTEFDRGCSPACLTGLVSGPPRYAPAVINDDAPPAAGLSNGAPHTGNGLNSAE